MLKIEITSAGFEVNSGTSAKNGKPFSFRKQRGYAYLAEPDGQPGKYPTPIQITLDDNQPPYQPGTYQLSPSSIYAGSFGKLLLGKIKLLPLAAGVSQPKAA